MIGTLVSGTVALVLPLFASYRALVSNDISLIRPWLMYWVVFGSFQFAESIFRPILQFVPFYGLMRLGFLMWLVLPQTQGAVQLYQRQIEPWLSSRDQAVDEAIAKVLSFIRSSPIGSILSLVGINIPDVPPSGPSGAAATQPGTSPAGYSVTDMLMSRFRLPTSPDAGLAAYIPSLLGNAAGNGAVTGEYTSAVRNRLLGMLRSLDANAKPDATTTTTVRETDEYDFVEAPKGTPPPGHGETEIEREVEDQLLGKSSSSSTQGQAQETRRRWF